MRDGCERYHKHRYVRVSRNSRLVRLLRKHIWITTYDKALNSRWTYGAHPHAQGLAVLTPLGILHSLAGIVLVYPNVEEGEGRDRTSDPARR